MYVPDAKELKLVYKRESIFIYFWQYYTSPYLFFQNCINIHFLNFLLHLFRSLFFFSNNETIALNFDDFYQTYIIFQNTRSISYLDLCTRYRCFVRTSQQNNVKFFYFMFALTCEQLQGQYCDSTRLVNQVDWYRLENIFGGLDV